MRLVLALLLLAVVGCGPKLLPTQITAETQNRIALCTGGYSTQARLEIAAEIGRRKGALISEAEAEERGVDTFAFGEQSGQAAVDMYNSYVSCIQAETGEANNDGTVSAPRWMYHEVGTIPSGEPVVQMPMPGQEKQDEEIQLQIVIEGDSWKSNGTPRWVGRCSGFGVLEQIGNNASYVYRFSTTGRASCVITLWAVEGSSYYWQQDYHVQVRR